MTSHIVNAHIHLPPNFSAFETPAQAVDLAAEQNLAALGVSNYYDYTAYGEFAARCAERHITPLFGTEIICMIYDLRASGVKINDPGNPGKMYLCGKGISRFAPLSAEAARLMQTIRNNDSLRMAEMTGRLSTLFVEAGLEGALTERDVKEMVVARHAVPIDTVYLQERHIAQAFQERLFATVAPDLRAAALERLFGSPAKCSPNDSVGVQNEIRSHLMKAGKPAFVPETFVEFDHAYRLILELGGIPCYPILADGASPICEYEADLDRLIAATLERGIFCCEIIPVRNSPEQAVRYASSIRHSGLIVTAGTEHNTRDLIPMAPTCAAGAAIPEAAHEIFWEGACVVSAHQYLSGCGEPGYVDAAGRLAGTYKSNEDRIAALRDIGEKIVSNPG